MNDPAAEATLTDMHGWLNDPEDRDKPGLSPIVAAVYSGRVVNINALQIPDETAGTDWKLGITTLHEINYLDQ